MHSHNCKRHRKFHSRTIPNPNKSQTRNYKQAINTFEQDLISMKQVWEILKTGAIRWFGEVGRQY